MDVSRRDERFAALAVGAAVTLLPPLLGVFNVEAWIFGVPVLFLYLFAVWLAVILCAAALTAGQQVGHPASHYYSAAPTAQRDAGAREPAQEETAPRGDADRPTAGP